MIKAKKSFAERLLELRGDLTQEQVASAAGVTRISIEKYESGKATPKADTLEKLADCFGVSVDYLLGRSDVKPIESPVKEIADSVGLSEAAIQSLIAFNNARKRDRIDSYDYEPAFGEIRRITVVLLLSQSTDPAIRNNDLLTLIALYLYGNFDKYYDNFCSIDDTESYGDVSTIGFWDSDLGIENSFPANNFEFVDVLMLQRLTDSLRREREKIRKANNKE